MIKALQKVLGGKQDEQLEGAVDQSVEAADATTVEQSLAQDLQGALAQVESLNAALLAKDTLVAELNSKLEQLSEFAAQAEAAAEALRVEAEQKALAEKREKLANVIGAENPGFEATFAAISGLDAEAFQTVVSGFAASFAKEAESVMFTQIGVSGSAEPVASDAPLNIKKYLKKNQVK